MGKIIEASELPEGDKVYLKKDFLGWRVVEPWRTPDGKLKLFNVLFGGKRGLLFLIIVMIISGLFYLGIDELIANYKIIADSPCNFCNSCFEQTRKVISDLNNQQIKFNISEISEFFNDVSFVKEGSVEPT